MAIGILLLLCLLFGDVFKQLRIVDLGGDHVSAAGPLAQVDSAAAVAAEGEVFLRPQHKRAADRTAKREQLFLRHTKLDDAGLANDARYQIVVVRFTNLTAIESARHKFLVIAKIIDKKFAVDFRSVHFRAAFPEKIGFF